MSIAKSKALVAAWKNELKSLGSSADAARMASYMKNNFQFYGVNSKRRKTAAVECLQQLKDAQPTKRSKSRATATTTTTTTTEAARHSSAITSCTTTSSSSTSPSPSSPPLSSLNTAAALKSPKRKARAATKAAAKAKSDFLEDWVFYNNLMELSMRTKQREIQYCAIDLLSSHKAKQCIQRFSSERAKEVFTTSFEKWITTKSWWDSVDALASHVGGAFFQHHGDVVKPILREWASSDSIWKQRTAIIIQLQMKANTDVDFLFEMCRKCAGTNEFFINKAIGWGLRQYARQDADAVKMFVKENEDKLHNLSKREALKHIK